MPHHDYTAAEALSLLLERVQKANDFLGTRIRIAIDAGHDIEEEQAFGDRRKRKRVYRKHVAYTDDEALKVALDVLQAHFFEFPLIVNAAAGNFLETRIEVPEPASPHVQSAPAEETRSDLFGEDKIIELEIETEATQSKAQLPNDKMTRYSPQAIEEIGKILEALGELLTFGDATDGHATRS